MKSAYEREDLRITEFDNEDVITTSGAAAPVNLSKEMENVFGSYQSLRTPGSWF